MKVSPHGLCFIILLLCQSCSQSNIPASEQAEKLSAAAYDKNQAGDYAGAIADCDKAIKINPKCWQAFDNRGVSRGMLSGNFVEAISDFDRAIELCSNDPTLYNDRGFAKEKLKSDKEAISDFNQAIELNPNDARIYINRTCAKYNLNDFDGAEADYKKALELDPHNNKVAELAQSGIDLVNKERIK